MGLRSTTNTGRSSKVPNIDVATRVARPESRRTVNSRRALNPLASVQSATISSTELSAVSIAARVWVIRSLKPRNANTTPRATIAAAVEVP